ncbi:MAG: hypothetical protein H0U09_10375 [Geodermatophilaceae bacterium]|nr:hypothetical protein [Geodermatophilaceae bacterium]
MTAGRVAFLIVGCSKTKKQAARTAWVADGLAAGRGDLLRRYNGEAAPTMQGLKRAVVIPG